MNLENWLKINKKVCLTNIDTRKLTKKIRDAGTCKALIHFPSNGKFEKIENLRKKLNDFPSMNNLDLVGNVSTKYIYKWVKGKKIKFNNTKKKIAVIDFGIKRNILNILSSYGYEVVVFS